MKKISIYHNTLSFYVKERLRGVKLNFSHNHGFTLKQEENVSRADPQHQLRRNRRPAPPWHPSATGHAKLPQSAAGFALPSRMWTCRFYLTHTLKRLLLVLRAVRAVQQHGDCIRRHTYKNCYFTEGKEKTKPTSFFRKSSDQNTTADKRKAGGALPGLLSRDDRKR